MEIASGHDISFRLRVRLPTRELALQPAEELLSRAELVLQKANADDDALAEETKFTQAAVEPRDETEDEEGKRDQGMISGKV